MGDGSKHIDEEITRTWREGEATSPTATALADPDSTDSDSDSTDSDSDSTDTDSDTADTTDAEWEKRDHATGHHYDWKTERISVQKPIDTTNLGAAGAIKSSARDMGNWLRFQLADGAFDLTQYVAPNALAAGPVLQEHAHLLTRRLARALGGRLHHLEPGDVTLVLQNPRNLGLQLRGRHRQLVVAGTAGIANPGEHVGNRIGHRHRSPVPTPTNSTSSVRGRSPRGPSRAGRSGTGRTCGSTRVAGRTAGSGCTRVS